MRPEESETYKRLFGEPEPRHKVVVYNFEDFMDHVKDGLKDNEVYIEIYSGPGGKPILEEDGENILKLDFEDLPEDMQWKNYGHRFNNPTITKRDARRTVEFIEKWRKEGKDFIVHCAAGVSRSQQVAAYILLIGWYDYEYDEERSTHPRHMAHTIVLTRLLEAKHKYIPDFNNRDNAFKYNAEKDKWIEE